MNISSTKKEVYLKEVISSFKNFELVKIFGSSHFSGVAVVKNNKLAGRKENIKFIESVEPNTKEIFLKEGKILSAVQHENTPRIYDIHYKDDLILFRTEHIEGYSLKDVLDYFKEINEKFPVNAATSIVHKLMEVLYYMHNEVRYNGKKETITHCDIKPSNIILCAKGYKIKDKVDDSFISLLKADKFQPYLIDFGIARLRGEKSRNGTSAYISPQTAFGKKEDWRTDIYQLLLVYYEMLSGNNPYSGIMGEELIQLKKNHDLRIKEKNIPKSIFRFIEKGTKRYPEDSFKSEKECVKRFSKISSRQRKVKFVKRNKKPILSVILIPMIISLSFVSYNLWDYHTQSTDALIKQIENNPNPTLEELEEALHKIQKRAFEKKYFEPLINGEFRNEEGKLLYPNHLNPDGTRAFVDVTYDEAGAFVGLLFNQVDKYPDILDYAIEYADSILNTKFDGSGSRKYAWALIPAYEITKDKRYLKKLVNVSEEFVKDFTIRRKGMKQTVDLYHMQLFLWLYKQTGERKYLNTAEKYMLKFIEHNIDNDGYVYEYTLINATSPYGPVPDDKRSKLVVSFDMHQVGNYISINMFEESNFKNISSIFSRDFIETLSVFNDFYKITNKTLYKYYLDKITKYYSDRMPKDNVDFFFVSYLNEENNIPKDTLAVVKSIHFFKEANKDIYYQKLKALLSSEYFRKEKENGILSGSVWIEKINYDHADETIKDQTLILTDKVFLELE